MEGPTCLFGYRGVSLILLADAGASACAPSSSWSAKIALPDRTLKRLLVFMCPHVLLLAKSKTLFVSVTIVSLRLQLVTNIFSFMLYSVNCFRYLILFSCFWLNVFFSVIRLYRKRRNFTKRWQKAATLSSLHPIVVPEARS